MKIGDLVYRISMADERKYEIIALDGNRANLISPETKNIVKNVPVGELQYANKFNPGDEVVRNKGMPTRDIFVVDKIINDKLVQMHLKSDKEMVFREFSENLERVSAPSFVSQFDHTPGTPPPVKPVRTEHITRRIINEGMYLNGLVKIEKTPVVFEVSKLLKVDIQRNELKDDELSELSHLFAQLAEALREPETIITTVS